MTTSIKKEWEQAQNWEAEWHSDCINSLNEELKQLVYAEKMGLVRKSTPKSPYNFDIENKSILDIGGGAYSILLKGLNIGKGTIVVDPLMYKYPQWVRDRYKEAKIDIGGVYGENIDSTNVFYDSFDEIWIYNVLQHTIDPSRIILNARRLGKLIRIFEWVDTPRNIGHIHTLTESNLNEWLGGEGKVEIVNRNGCVGKCYYGIFLGNSLRKAKRATSRSR